jgi:translation initiation factor IF-2
MPSKVGKAGASTKTKDWRRKPDNIRGLKRQLVSSQDAIANDEAKEINVPIPGLSNVRKSRKFSKATCKAARAQAARETTPVKVEILEVGKQGMTVLELAHNLAVNEAEVVRTLF